MLRGGLILVFLSLGFLGQAKKIEVCSTCEISSIKKAVEVAKDGDVIFVKKGIYKENSIEIYKSITIYGEVGTIVDGSNKEGIFIISANNFTIRNLKIINVGISYIKEQSAIKVFKSNNFTIKNIVLANVYFGFLIEKSHFGKIINNTVSSLAKNEANSGNGIHIWHSSNVEVEGNEVFGMRDGIYFEFVTQSKIHNNFSHNNIRYGLHFMFSNNDTYYNNEFKNNGAGVAVMFSKFIKMYQNKFIHNWGSASYGLLLKEIYDAEIYNNIFQENTIGIKGEGCNRINYKNNTFLRNGWAIKIAGACYANIFEYNDFLHNSLDLSYDTKVNDNKFENNYWSEYTGYDLDKDGIGDIPYRPVKLFSYIVNRTPEALVLLRSLFVDIINFSEKVSPVFTPDDLMDINPVMKRIND
ncbi:nitrous oxide reductase family maturation protein NosD [Lutibacter sp.]|uniref:nitrous oxide reductase family maturation protein NosD n=1 Tax=Lutibacter sp. TaxID=1925666 RepID=UPI0027357690|nr:nitrous oxide reductase family maturation protein NosD [Lutibacter sp.]MDP3313636.1 nitrous oxide reductase family maturation protein NosD [Lutibacter sp.]